MQQGVVLQGVGGVPPWRQVVPLVSPLVRAPCELSSRWGIVVRVDCLSMSSRIHGIPSFGHKEECASHGSMLHQM